MKLKWRDGRTGLVLARIAIGAALIFIGVGGMKKLQGMRKPPGAREVGERAITVEGVIVRPRDHAVSISGYGETRTLNFVAISPEAAGRVTNVHERLEVGEIVPRGEVLLVIDDRDYRAALSEAVAMVELRTATIARLEQQLTLDRERLESLGRIRDLAWSEYERRRKLLDYESVGTRSEVEAAEQAYHSALDRLALLEQSVALYPVQIREAQSSLRSAQARLATAELAVSRCRIVAPFDARLRAVDVELGQYVTPGQVLLTLADDSVLELHVPLDNNEARKWLAFREPATGLTNAWFGALAPVQCDVRWTEARDGHTWTGRLHRIVSVDPPMRTITVAIRLDTGAASQSNPAGMPLVEGMFCSVTIPGKTLHNVFRLPRSAVSFENTAYVVVSNRLRTVSVEVPYGDEDDVFVSGGLTSGDEVITTRLVAPLENSLIEWSELKQQE